MTKAEQILQFKNQIVEDQEQKRKNRSAKSEFYATVLDLVKEFYTKRSGEEFGKFLKSGTRFYERTRILVFFHDYFEKKDKTFEQFKQYVQWSTLEWKFWSGGNRDNYIGFIVSEPRYNEWIKRMKSKKTKIAGKNELWNK